MKKNSETVATNRKAHFNYQILDTYEAGLMLTGPEVKSLRLGHAQIAESYISPDKGELFLVNAHIDEYKNGQGGFVEQKVNRPRKILLHQKELSKLIIAVHQKRLTIVPLDLYFNSRGIAKVKIALCQGKDVRDKRNTIKEREWKKEQGRIMRARNH